jgi:hypothetical protein
MRWRREKFPTPGGSCRSLAGIATVYGLDDRGSGAGNFSLLHCIQTDSDPTQPPIQWVPGDLSMAVKWPGPEADHSLPSSAEVKKCVEPYPRSPNTPSRRGVQLQKARGLYMCVNV